MLSLKDITFDFIDAPHLSDPAPGIALFYSGPYYSFYNATEKDYMEHAHKWLDSSLMSDGPYDAVMCFSQGCALVATYLLWRQSRDLPSPFKSAMFICGGIPLQFLESLGVQVTASMHEYDDFSRVALSKQASLDALLIQGEQRWEGSSSPPFSHDVGMRGSAEIIIDDLDLGSLETALRIKIPTAHVVGHKDPRYLAGLHLAKFCDGEQRRFFDHEGGHTIPRAQWVSQEMAALLVWMQKQSEAS